MKNVLMASNSKLYAYLGHTLEQEESEINNLSFLFNFGEAHHKWKRATVV